MTQGKLIQGGTCNRKIGALKEALAGGYDHLFLFPDHDGYYNAQPFGFKKTNVMEDFATEEARAKCKVWPVPLHDIVEGRPWEEKHLSVAWSMAFYIKKLLESGATVAIACTAGKNRSMSMQYAVAPSPYHRSLVQCSLMRRWAEAFHESVVFNGGKIPEDLFPLTAEQREPKQPVAMADAAPAKTKVDIAALQERIRARDLATRALASPIAKRR